MSQIVFQKDLFAVVKVKVKVTVMENIIQILPYDILSELLILLQLGLIVHHHKVDCLVKRLNCSVVVRVKVTERVKNSSDCTSGQTFITF